MIACIGEALIDFIPVQVADGERAYIPRIGGSPLNTATTCGRLEHPTIFLTRLSSDFFGNDILRHYKANGISTEFLSRGDEPTTLAFVRRSESGDAEYAFFAKGAADRLLGPSDLPKNLPTEVTCIQCGSISTQMEPSATTIEAFVSQHSSDRVIAYDPNIRTTLIADGPSHRKRVERFFDLAGLVKISDVDLEWLYPETPIQEAGKTISERGVPLVVVTAGPDGSIAYTGNTTVHVPANTPPGGVKDTVGAGDSFHGALITWLDRKGLMTRNALSNLKEDTVREALEFASMVAAITCSRSGAEPPSLKELPAT